MLTVFVVLSLAQVSPLVQVSPRENGVMVLTFSDRDGEHQVTFTEYPVEKVKRDDEWVKSASLTVVSEVRKTPESKWVTTWSAKDFVKDCDFDLSLRAR